MSDETRLALIGQRFEKAKAGDPYPFADIAYLLALVYKQSGTLTALVNHNTALMAELNVLKSSGSRYSGLLEAAALIDSLDPESLSIEAYSTAAIVSRIIRIVRARAVDAECLVK